MTLETIDLAQAAPSVSPEAVALDAHARRSFHQPLPRPDLSWTPAVEAATAHLYARVSKVIPPVEWPFHAPYVKAINDLKKVRNAVILAHNYQTPEIYNCVADYVGDSLQLAKMAAASEADVIVQGGVHFMAETSKVLNPAKTVLIPDSQAGCSLAESITAADIRALRAQYPGVPIVAYVNTSAEVKAEVDICCTSSNAVKVVESLGVERVIMVPDRYLAENVAAQTSVKIIAWHGACEVHERFTAEEIQTYRTDHPGLTVIAHPECPREVVEVSDFSGSTAAMIDYVRTKKPARVLLVTECSMSDNVAAETTGTQFVRPCNFCPHMKRITLPRILDSLLEMREEVVIDPALATRARRSVQRMIDLG
jgi:quinolinate synthase